MLSRGRNCVCPAAVRSDVSLEQQPPGQWLETVALGCKSIVVVSGRHMVLAAVVVLLKGVLPNREHRGRRSGLTGSRMGAVITQGMTKLMRSELNSKLSSRVVTDHETNCRQRHRPPERSDPDGIVLRTTEQARTHVCQILIDFGIQGPPARRTHVHAGS